MNSEFGHNRGPPAGKSPQMMAAAVKGLQLVLKLSPERWRTQLASVGLTPERVEDGDALIPLEQGFSAFEAAPAWGDTNEQTLILRYADAFEVGGAGPIGFAAHSAKTVRDALRTITRFLPLVSSVYISRYEENETSGTIVWRYASIPTKPRTQFMLWGCALLMRRLAPAMPEGWKPCGVEIDAAAPAEIAAFKEYFGSGLRFGADNNRFSVQAEFLDRPMPTANPRLFQLMTRLAEVERQRRGLHSSQFEERAREAITQLLLEGQTSAAALAEKLGMAPPDFRRKLKEHDLDYRALLEDVRKETARNYLTNSEASITEIAFNLGYAETSVFTRAFKKWFKLTPSEMRLRNSAH